MKKLSVYYSLTGNLDIVSEKLKEQGFEIRKVEKKKPLPKSFFWSIMTGGFLAGFKVKSKVKEFDQNIEEFEEIYIGSPIWNARLSSPINKVLSLLDLKDKKVTFILSAGSGEGKKALKRITKEYPDAKVIFLKEPKKYPEELDKVSID